MKELKIEDKQKYLDDHYLFHGAPKITDKKRCIHCNSVFVIGDYKVYKDEDNSEYICCPNAPDCNGTVIDWIDLD